MGDGVMKGTEVNPSKLQVNLFSSKLERGLVRVMEWSGVGGKEHMASSTVWSIQQSLIIALVF